MDYYIDLYADFLKKHVRVSRPLSIVCDSSNGATGKILAQILPTIGLKNVTIINSTPDPEFPAHGPNPLLPGTLDELCRVVVEKKADLGVVYDADGDRAFFVDEKGRALPSYIIAALLFINSEPPFVSDELVYQTLYHMKLFPEEILHASRVGVFFIKQKMAEVKATTGAEFSGHFYFKDFFGADSGIFTTLQVISILSKGAQTLSEFAASLPPHTVRNEDLKIEGKDWSAIQQSLTDVYTEKRAILERREGVTIQTPTGWINVRPSNTEPILRLYAGAKTEADCLGLLSEIRALV